MADNIILIGFMGSGKSTMGVMLSYKLRRPFLDTDKWIEKQVGRCISDIFAVEGEEYFRQQETELLKRLQKERAGKIISVGGGTPLREENRKLLHQLGTVLYLKVSAETVYERLRGDNTRPLLQGDDPMEKIRNLLERRSSIYEEAADAVVIGDGKKPAKVLKEILEVCK